MPFQDATGVWYDDEGNVIANPNGQDAGLTLGTLPSGTSPWNLPTAPTYPGQTENPGATIGGQLIYSGPTPPTHDATGAGGPAPSPTDWQNLQSQTFGAMPSVSGATPPPFSYDPFTAPAPFAPPSAQDVLFSDPGFQFRLDQGTGAMQNSAAARGVLNTGGTLKDLVDYGQSAGSQEYGQAFNRALGTYDENYRNSLNSYITNFGNALTKYNTNYGTQYLTPYNQLMGQYGQGVNNQAQLFGQQFQTATA